jgi:hypothetical protein
MPNISGQLGDDRGHGHELRVILQDDGIAVLLSRNPDTEETSRIVLMESQWRLLLRFLLTIYGREKCCYFGDGMTCSAEPTEIAV